MSSLRQRNRRAAIEQIQRAAFELFDEYGYDAVTINQIAARAEVSPSTFYRLFETKEGLFTIRPWEAGAARWTEVDPGDLAHALKTLVAGNQWPGMKWVMQEPAVRGAVLAELDALTVEFADSLSTARGDRTEMLVRLRQLVFGVYLTSLEQWHLDGQAEPFEDYYDRNLALLEGN